MKPSKKGIVAGGNWIIDQVKIVDFYPQEDELAKILYQGTSNGGSPYNLLKNFARLGVSIKLSAAGLVGGDSNGKWIIDDCIKNGIDKKWLQVKKEAITSFTDVITSASSGRRTFFHQQGTCAQLSTEHFRLDKYKAGMFHLGYLLLLSKLDELDEKGRTEASYLLEKAQNLGMKTSADVISLLDADYQKVATPSLPFINYFFLNDYEAAKLSGIEVKTNGEIDIEKLTSAAQKVLDMGVNNLVSVHFDKGILLVEKDGKVWLQGKPIVPKEEHVGNAGVGEAVMTGILWAIHEGLDFEKGLELASAMAGCCMLDASCSNGILPLEQTLEKAKEWKVHQF
ncbi:carbohydrate kinase family protein [Flammeovirgaceae bacterium SG7u.111]|nr:carbohydrate kinase family protein [Flammeovirgaceae bacterium SG7u.132]WPO35329.1 carbohydrate kinase family protein [Flammeovirgaceae bacterium SG7u.111]